jgi:hypothetical protein
MSKTTRAKFIFSLWVLAAIVPLFALPARTDQSPFDQLDPQVRHFLTQHKLDTKNWYNQLDFLYRVSAACVVTKILEEPVPDTFGEISDVSRGGMMEFKLVGKEFEPRWLTELDTQVQIADMGYTDDFGAADGNRRWGRRNPREGAQLHYSMNADLDDETLGVHIDLMNPGEATLSDYLIPTSYFAKGVTHLSFDKWFDAWNTLHTPYILVHFVRNRCGIGHDDYDRAMSCPPFTCQWKLKRK